jgi:hypothetical protein
MKNGETLNVRFARGSLAGLAGTMAMQAVMGVQQKKLPEASPPMKGNPAHFMVEKLEQALPEKVRGKALTQLEQAIEGALPVGYGATFGSLYAALRPKGGNPLVDGTVLGLASWAVGFLGWLRAADLIPPVREHKPHQVATSIIEHALYGIAVVGAYNWLRKRI